MGLTMVMIWLIGNNTAYINVVSYSMLNPATSKMSNCCTVSKFKPFTQANSASPSNPCDEYWQWRWTPTERNGALRVTAGSVTRTRGILM